ncbi:hypothetical protein CRG98_009369 [Punica granatum]|uniref:Uncharacterized protein n=1 Tax=Punica granatum TaxID=22663 RepID=A0A2I0KP12_PUNGR|nr:hypothetical protein CRG98_009369 [Punica granatum]
MDSSTYWLILMTMMIRGDVSPDQGVLMKESCKKKRQLDDAKDEVEDEDVGTKDTSFSTLAEEPNLQTGGEATVIDPSGATIPTTPDRARMMSYAKLLCFTIRPNDIINKIKGTNRQEYRIDALVIQGLRDDVRKFSDKIQSLEKEVEEKVKEKRAMKQSLDQADSLVVKA